MLLTFPEIEKSTHGVRVIYLLYLAVLFIYSGAYIKNCYFWKYPLNIQMEMLGKQFDRDFMN